MNKMFDTINVPTKRRRLELSDDSLAQLQSMQQTGGKCARSITWTGQQQYLRPGISNIADDILFLISTWAGLEDVSSLSRVCRRWRDIFRGGETSAVVWQGIANYRHPFLQSIWINARRAPPAARLTDSQLWIDVLKSRETNMRLRPDETVDVLRPYPGPTSARRSRFGPTCESWRDEQPWLGSLKQYRFTVHVWDLMGAKHSIPVESSHFDFGMICMRTEVNTSVGDIGRAISSGKLHGLEIEVCFEGKLAVIYSGLLPFEAFGGDNFEKFAEHGLFSSRDVDDDNCCSFGWAPFAAPPFAIGGWKLGEGNTLALEMEWRHRKKGEHYKRQEGMQPPDVFAFLRKGLQYTRHRDPTVDRWTLPRCISRKGRLVTGLSSPRYRPREMSSFAFVIDVINDKVTPKKSCSLYYEDCKKTLAWHGRHEDHTEKWRYDHDWSSMFFAVTPECKELLPGFDDRGEFLIDERAAVIAIYVVDKETGKQAKLYQSHEYKTEWSWADWGNFYAFEPYSAVGYFSTASGEGIPVPSVRAMYHGDNDIWVNFNWFISPSDPALINMTEEELSIFLDKGLVYV